MITYPFQKTLHCQNRLPTSLLAAIATLTLATAMAQQKPPARKDSQDVNSAELRKVSGLEPDHQLLFNGWGLSPAATSVSISDLALKLVVSPDRKCLLAVSA